MMPFLKTPLFDYRLPVEKRTIILEAGNSELVGVSLGNISSTSLPYSFFFQVSIDSYHHSSTTFTWHCVGQYWLAYSVCVYTEKFQCYTIMFVLKIKVGRIQNYDNWSCVFWALLPSRKSYFLYL